MEQEDNASKSNQTSYCKEETSVMCRT